MAMNLKHAFVRLKSYLQAFDNELQLLIHAAFFIYVMAFQTSI